MNLLLIKFVCWDDGSTDFFLYWQIKLHVYAVFHKKHYVMFHLKKVSWHRYKQ